MEKIIESRDTFLKGETDPSIRILYIDENPEIYIAQVICPIVMQGDPIGSLILISKDNDMGNLEKVLLETASKFLSKQMEH